MFEMSQPATASPHSWVLKLVTEPWSAMRALVSAPAGPGAIVLAAVWGIDRNLRDKLKASFPFDETFSLPLSLLATVVLGALFGIGMWYVSSGLAAWVAGKLGHPVTSERVRLVLAWSTLPRIVNVVVLGGFAATIGQNFWTLDQRALLAAYPASLPAVFVPWTICSFWAGLLAVVGLSEVGEMSFGRSVVVWILTGVPLIAGYLVALTLAFALLAG